MEKVYDIAILGAGPGGMTAGIYAKRAGLDVIIIEKSMPGGAISTTHEVANYTGFTKIGGIELSTKMFEHTQSLDIEYAWDEVKKVEVNSSIKIVHCYKNVYKAKTVIIGLGAAVRKLNLDNEKQFIGKGISYCATCDGTLFKNKTVAVVGGGNTALQDALYLGNIVQKVYLIHRRDEFRGDDILAKEIQQKNNIEIVFNSTVSKLNGDKSVKSIEVLNKVDNKSKKINVDGIFVAIGRGPDTEIIDGFLKLSENGYIITDENMKTNIDGVYAIGDIRQTPLRQIVTACSDGAIAATKAFEFIKTSNR